ncbi:MAG: hypothetical protein HC882_00255 [Acidobacteria bacterium]|nr:hypothetical protein [Acidobacteriota bacterium]
MRFARVVAKTARGMDFMYFEPDGRPRSGPVVAPVACAVDYADDLARMRYRGAVALRMTDGAHVVLSGLSAAGRVRFGTTLRPGDPVGVIEQPSDFSPETLRAFRGRDVTAGADPIYPYLHMEIWAEMPTVIHVVTVRGPQYVFRGGRRINPVTWWRAQGYELVGPSRSETLEAVVGGPSDPSRCA